MNEKCEALNETQQPTNGERLVNENCEMGGVEEGRWWRLGDKI